MLLAAVELLPKKKTPREVLPHKKDVGGRGRGPAAFNGGSCRRSSVMVSLQQTLGGDDAL